MLTDVQELYGENTNLVMCNWLSWDSLTGETKWYSSEKYPTHKLLMEAI